MIKRIQEPDLRLVSPTFEISDGTAAIKAKRLMNELKKLGEPEVWFQNCATLGLKANASNTRRWRAILDMPRRRSDVRGIWLDRNGNQMEKPDSRKTAEVAVATLLTDDPQSSQPNQSESELYLGLVNFQRKDFLRAPGHRISPSNAGLILHVSQHVLQRMIQRGFSLTETGEISYRGLIEFFLLIYAEARQKTKEIDQYPATFNVEIEGAVFVVKAPSDHDVMTLLTMLPPAI